MPDEGALIHLRRAIGLAVEAREAGDDPFGSVLVDVDGTVLREDRNRAPSTADVSAHPEIVQAVWAGSALTPDRAARTTMYASTEPCAMCAQAMVYAGVGRLVYSVGAAELGQRFAARGLRATSVIPSRELFARTGSAVEVTGPLLLEEGLAAYGDWPPSA